jgi:CelD/BcsL family acetyltransferase involved in cellulose biosynthesis
VTSLAPAAEAPSEPACPLVARPIAFDAIPRATWEGLFARTARTTPFSRWTWHRAWWDAYASTAHEQYLACVTFDQQHAPLEQVAIRGLVPLMHRHAVEADDAAAVTVLRHAAQPGATALAADAKVIYFAATYHADYATLLCDPADLDDVARATADALAGPPDPAHGHGAWDAVDLRRLHAADPALPALARAFERVGHGRRWAVHQEREDVCPVVTVPEGLDWEGYLGTLDKKDRHEIRRKVRRAEAAGPCIFRLVEPTPDAVERFIELHDARWGEAGLFPANPGGERSRRFVARLAELERAEGVTRQLQLGQFEVAGRVIFATLGFDDGTCYFYNAGLDPAAKDLSPGVTGAAAYLRTEMEGGCRRFDFLRGAESYKYEWGARDEPLERLLVTRPASS